MIQRGGQVVIRMLADVKQRTIGPIIEATIAPGPVVYTDEYDIYARLPHGAIGTGRSAMRRGVRPGRRRGRVLRGARQHDGRVLVVARSWLRPHRGVSQEKLPLYLGFFEFVHNVRRRGKALLGALVAALVM